jgi:hypothetical protein
MISRVRLLDLLYIPLALATAPIQEAQDGRVVRQRRNSQAGS